MRTEGQRNMHPASVICSAIDQLRGERLLDWNGGAVSARKSESEFAISPGGAARKLWVVEPSSVQVHPLGRRVERLLDARPPLGATIHQYLYRHLPSLEVVIHSHAGWGYQFSLLGTSSFPELPQTGPLGAIPVIGDNSRGGASESLDIEEWNMRFVIPEIAGLIDDWRQALNLHGVAFIEKGHGYYILGRTWRQALVDAARLESACRSVLIWMTMHGAEEMPTWSHPTPKE